MGLLPMVHARLPARKTKVIISPDAPDAAFPWKEEKGHGLSHGLKEATKLSLINVILLFQRKT